MKLPSFTAEASHYKVSDNYPKASHVNMDTKSHVTMQQISQLDSSWTRQEPQLCAAVERVCPPPEIICRWQDTPHGPYWYCSIAPIECHWECRPPGYNRANFQSFSELIYSRSR